MKLSKGLIVLSSIIAFSPIISLAATAHMVSVQISPSSATLNRYTNQLSTTYTLTLTRDNTGNKTVDVSVAGLSGIDLSESFPLTLSFATSTNVITKDFTATISRSTPIGTYSIHITAAGTNSVSTDSELIVSGRRHLFLEEDEATSTEESTSTESTSTEASSTDATSTASTTDELGPENKGQETVAIKNPRYNFISNIRFGQRGELVKQIQIFLNSYGYHVSNKDEGSKGKETIYFGTLTRDALKKFQKDHNIPDTGFFGPLTRAFINSLK